MQLHLKGLIAAVVTPTQANGEINLGVMPKYIDFLLEQNVKSVFVNGTTGEWPSFSVDERKKVAESWVANGRNKLDNIIIHCGAQSYKDAQELVKHAASIKADAVSCISPSVFKPCTEDEHVAYFKKIMEVSPDTPFMFYYLPGLTGVNVTFSSFLPLLSKEVKSFVGLKISSPNLGELSECIQFHKEHKAINICYGVDQQLHSAFIMGVESAVGSFYNFLGKQFNEIIENNRTNMEKASALQRKIAVEILPLVNRHGPAVNKLMTSMFSGVDMGQARLPLKQFTEDEINSIEEYLKQKNYPVKDC